MRWALAAGLFVALPGVGSANPRPGPKIVYGWGERIGEVAELPAPVRSALRPPTGSDLAVGYHYQTFFLFSPGFHLWTSDGEYVLYNDVAYFSLTDDQLAGLIGEDAVQGLSRPLRYRFPVGLVTLCGLAVGLAVAGYTSAQARARRLLKSEVIQSGLQAYSAALPTDRDPTPEDRRAALEKGVAHLVETHGLPPSRAASALRLVVGEVERGYSYELRNAAVAHEEAGEWEPAAQLYEAAADMMAEWDAKDAEFLRKCVRRVRDKQARAGG